MKAVKFYDCRLKREHWVNPDAVLSFYDDSWPNTVAVSAIEVKGQQGYGNHTLRVVEDCATIADKLEFAK